jgi:hypothetical protein
MIYIIAHCTDQDLHNVRNLGDCAPVNHLPHSQDLTLCLTQFHSVASVELNDSNEN